MGCFGRKKVTAPATEEVWLAQLSYGNCPTNVLQVTQLALTLCCLCQAINTNRRCRDLIYLILFAVFWGGMLYVAYLAFKRGLSGTFARLCCSINICLPNFLGSQANQSGWSMQLTPMAICVGLTTTGMGQAGLISLPRPSCTISTLWSC